MNPTVSGRGTCGLKVSPEATRPPERPGTGTRLPTGFPACQDSTRDVNWQRTENHDPTMDTWIYGICLALGLLFSLFSAILGHVFGGDGEIGTGGHAEAGMADSGLPGVSFFSPTVMAAFVTAFGAAGLIFSRIEATRSVWISAPLAAASGGVIAALTFWFFNTMFRKTQASSEARVAQTIGLTASVITPIPADGVGEIAYVVANTRYSAPARSEGGVPIPAGRTVTVKRMVGGVFYVEPIKPESSS